MLHLPRQRAARRVRASAPRRLRTTGCALVFALLLLAPLGARAEPPEGCSDPREGRGKASGVFLDRLEEASAIEDLAEFRSRIEALRPDTKTPFEKAVLDLRLGRRLAHAGADAEARLLLEPLIEDPYLARAARDSVRNALALSAERRRDPAGVVQLLEPMLHAACAPMPDDAYYRLALAYLQQKRGRDALATLDLAPRPPTKDQNWWTSARTELRCKHEGAAACVEDIASQLERGHVDEELLGVLQTLFDRTRASGEAVAAIDAARGKGLVNEAHQLVVQAPAVERDLIPRIRHAPQYPPAALRRGQMGFVTLRLAIDAEGRVDDVTVLDSSPPGVFDRESIRAARRSQFEPKLVDGVPVPTTGTYTVHFTIAR